MVNYFPQNSNYKSVEGQAASKEHRAHTAVEVPQTVVPTAVGQTGYSRNLYDVYHPYTSFVDRSNWRRAAAAATEDGFAAVAGGVV